MVEFGWLVIGVALLCAVGFLLDAGRAPRWVGGIPLAAAGAVTGFVGSLVLALGVWPGACMAVLCPSCYREPTADGVWRAALAYLLVAGVTAVTLPGTRFRLGFALGVAPGALDVASRSFAVGEGSAVLLAAAVALSLGGLRPEVAARVRGSGVPDDAGASRESARDFWDGAGWIPSPGGAGSRPPQTPRPHS